MSNQTAQEVTNTTGHKHGSNTAEMHTNIAIYIGIGVGSAVFVIIIITIALLVFKRRGSLPRTDNSRRIFMRGFSTVSQRGVLDSTDEFEITNVMGSVSSQGGRKQAKNADSKMASVPKKPKRRKTRTSSSNPPQYENVAINQAQQNQGYFITRSGSNSSDIPYMDTTLESRISRDDELDDVFD